MKHKPMEPMRNKPAPASAVVTVRRITPDANGKTGSKSRSIYRDDRPAAVILYDMTERFPAKKEVANV